MNDSPNESAGAVSAAEAPTTEPRRTGLVWAALAVLLGVGGMATLMTVARTVGPDLRGVAMVETSVNPVGSVVPFDDASPEAASFLAARDSAEVTVPWTMTVGEFLGLYHLENSQSARTALEEQLGVVNEDEVLREGSAVSLVLTPERGPS